MKALIALLVTVGAVAGQWPPPKSPAVPEADGYVEIPNAALVPEKTNSYRAIFDATRGADKPFEPLPAINMAGSELNALAVMKIPLSDAKFAVVFHGSAVDGILDDAHYKAKFGICNPNLKSIAVMKKHGVKFFVCGQYLVAAQIDPKTITPDVTLVADALLVLMQYQKKGYALMSF